MLGATSLAEPELGGLCRVPTDMQRPALEPAAPQSIAVPEPFLHGHASRELRAGRTSQWEARVQSSPRTAITGPDSGSSPPPKVRYSSPRKDHGTSGVPNCPTREGGSACRHSRTAAVYASCSEHCQRAAACPCSALSRTCSRLGAQADPSLQAQQLRGRARSRLCSVQRGADRSRCCLQRLRAPAPARRSLC